MVRFVTMVGLPGCGKSTLASKMEGYAVISPDKIREESCGDENVQADPGKIFEEAKRRIVKCINSGKNVILDATDVNRKKRMTLLNDIKKQAKPHVDLICTAIWVAVPYNTVIKRNKNRWRVVPEAVIEKMYKNFMPPGYDEGFDDIRIDFAGSEDWGIKNVFEDYDVNDFLNKADAFDQKNRHHALTLGGHCRKTAELVAQNHHCTSLLFDTALIHDNGKIFTCTPKVDKEGNPTGECSYHRHHCTGSYDAVFYLKNLGHEDDECICGARLIAWHMRPLLEWGNGKTRQKETAAMDPQFHADLMVLHDADVNAH